MGSVRLGLEMLGFGVDDVLFFFFDRWRVGFEKASGLDYKLMYVVNMIFATFYCGCFSYFILLYILMLFSFFLL